MLSGLEMENLIPLFHQHDVKFEQFLYLTMNDLISIGVSQLGKRKRILQAVYDVFEFIGSVFKIYNFSVSPSR